MMFLEAILTASLEADDTIATMFVQNWSAWWTSR